MKITDVTVHKMNPGVGKNFVFVKIQTDAGITGWGEAYTQADRDIQIEAHIHQLGRYLDGRDPFHIRHFTHIVHEDFATKRPGMDLHCAVSGIEIAMWDIVGKALERPVYDLLGGTNQAPDTALRQRLGRQRIARRSWPGRSEGRRGARVHGPEIRPRSPARGWSTSTGTRWSTPRRLSAPSGRLWDQASNCS